MDLLEFIAIKMLTKVDNDILYSNSRFDDEKLSSVYFNIVENKNQTEI